MQGFCHGFINGKQDVKAAEKRIVYYFELFGTL